jgi:hypothetical protein
VSYGFCVRKVLWLLVLAASTACGRARDDESALPGSGGRTGGNSGGETPTDGSAGGTNVGGANSGGSLGGDSSTASGGSADDTCSLSKGDQEYIYVKTQADAENLKNVRKVTGSIYLTEGVTDLSSLNCLEEITGDLGIYEARELVDLHGLENLKTLGGKLYVGHYCTKHITECTGNPKLENLDGLRSLESVKELVIEPKCDGEGNSDNCTENSALAEVELTSLSSAERVYLRYNKAIREVHLDALTKLNELTITNHPVLETVSLNELSTVETFTVNHAYELTELSARKLTRVGNLEVEHIHVADLTGLSQLSSVGMLRIDGNAVLTSLAGLENVDWADEVLIMQNPALESLAGLDSLNFVTVRLTLSFNASLPALTGLDQLQKTYDLVINGNSALTDLSALDALGSVPGYFAITGNNVLPLCEITALMNRMGPDNLGPDITISGNDETATCEP